MSARRFKLLALHGKGTSAKIMKAQIKPIVDALGDMVEVDFLDGGYLSAPYQGIESLSPQEPYFAWYDKPTRTSLQAAHDRVAERLGVSRKGSSSSSQGNAVSIATSFQAASFEMLTPPETPVSDTPGSLNSDSMLRRPSGGSPNSEHDSLTKVNSGGRSATQKRFIHPVAGLDTPSTWPNSAGPMTPFDTPVGSYDGLICFSQGCAVSTGLLLEMGAKMEYDGAYPVRFVILICGGRPFDLNGSMQRVEKTDIRPIRLPSIHVQGRQDPGLDESKRLASLFDETGKQVIELDIGHCPPRRTLDVNMVAEGIRRLLSQLK